VKSCSLKVDKERQQGLRETDQEMEMKEKIIEGESPSNGFTNRQ
jgi:hypothetical protein